MPGPGAVRQSLLLVCVLAFGIAARAQAESAAPIRLDADLQVREIAPGVWLHTAWMEVKGWGRFPSNGLLLVAPAESLLIDTPANEALTERLLQWVGDVQQAPVRRAILTHAHEDRMGGAPALRRAGVTRYALPQTAARAEALGWERPEEELAQEDELVLDGRHVQTYFPGAGHSPDNLVVWLPAERILFAGCLVKSEESQGLGNLADAVLAAWPDSLERLAARYATARLVVPGHGAIGGPAAIEHTRTLLMLHAHGA